VEKEKKSERLELLHTYVWGPSQVSSLGGSHYYVTFVDTERGVNQYQVQFKTFFNLYLNHSTISNEK
jgi:hypothetical protein